MALHTVILKYRARFQSGKLSKPQHCAACGQKTSLKWHGHYHRSLVTSRQTYRIPVKRLCCSLCRHTFSLLPSFVIKFHRYAKEIIMLALRKLKTLSYERVANWFMENGSHDIAPLTLYLWRRKFA